MKPAPIAAALLLALVAGGVWLALAPSATDSRRAIEPEVEELPSASRSPVATEPRDDGAQRAIQGAEPGAEPEPTRAAVDAGLGGRVVARGGAPIAGARVSIAWIAPNGERALGETRSGADGTFAHASPELAAAIARDGAAEIALRAAAIGYQPHGARRTVDAASARALLVRLEPGSALRGRVVDGAGRAVAAADVALELANGDRASLLATATSARDGRFELGFVSAAAYRLFARADGVGTALVEPLALAAGDDRDLGDVVLRGARAIRGRAIGGDGRPARALELWIVAIGDGSAPPTLAAGVARARERERGDGLSCSRATTGADGAFRFEGLCAGAFVLRAADAETAIEAPASIEAGEHELVVVVRSQRVLARVVDARGAAVAGANVACTELVEGAGAFEAGRVRNATTRGDGVAAFAIAADRPCALVARTRGARSTEEVVVLAPGESEAERELRLVPAEANAHLRVTVLGDDGIELRPLRIALLEAASGLRREDLGVLEPDAAGLLPPLAPGRYGVLAGFPEEPPTLHFPAALDAPIELVAGRTSELTLRAKSGSRVEVAIAAGGIDGRALERERDGFALMLADAASGRTQSLSMRIDGAIVTALLPGERGVSTDLVEPGAWTLRATSATFRDVERPLRLAPAAIERVEIDPRTR